MKATFHPRRAKYSPSNIPGWRTKLTTLAALSNLLASHHSTCQASQSLALLGSSDSTELQDLAPNLLEQQYHQSLRWLRNLQDQPQYVRPFVKHVTNGGKLTVKFDKEMSWPSDIESLLNDAKDTYVVMRVAPQGKLPPPLPANIPQYPVDMAMAVLNIDQQTKDMIPIDVQNAQALRQRQQDLAIVDWELIHVSGRHMTFQLLFAKPQEISHRQDSTDTLHIELNLQQFTSVEGEFIPQGSSIKRDLPTQMDVETGEKYETAGSVVSWIMLALMFVNGGLNTMWDELDYSALMDAVEGPQLISFVAAMDVTLPPDVNSFFASIRGVGAVEPTEQLIGDDAASVADQVFGERPPTEPLNTQVATIGYDDMTPLDEVSTVSVMFAMQAAGILILLLCFFCAKKSGSMLAERVGVNLQQLCLWGSLINLIVLNYLPVTVSMFIAVVGLQWDEQAPQSVTSNNIWTLILLHAWLLCPIFLFVQLFRKRGEIGEKRQGAQSDRDFTRMKERHDMVKAKQIQDEDNKRNPYGLIDSFKKHRAQKKQLQLIEIGGGSHQNQQLHEGGEIELRPLITGLAKSAKSNFMVDGEPVDLENPKIPKKNAWKICGKKVPDWMAPRQRNKDKKTKQKVFRRDETHMLPVNRGVKPGTYTKEDSWAGPVDKDYGEFYKKMNLDKKTVNKESVLFYGLFNMYRKLMYATTLVFFDDFFRLQCFTQMACAGIMALYIINYWPCARYIDNVSKIINELTFVAILANAAYIKELRTKVGEFNPSETAMSAQAPIGGVMVGITAANLAFHAFRLIHNSCEAAQTIKLRRRQLASKWLGPPTFYDSKYDPESSSDEEPSIKIPVDETPDLTIMAPPKVKDDIPERFCELKSGLPAKVKDYLPEKNSKPIRVDNIIEDDIEEPELSDPEPIIPPPKTPEAEIEEKQPDFDLKLPDLVDVVLLGFEPRVYELVSATMPEDADIEWQLMPDQPGKENELGLVMPKMLEQTPGEPQICPDHIINEDDDHIVLGNEIELPPTKTIDDLPHMIGPVEKIEMPLLLDIEIPAPPMINFDVSCLPPIRSDLPEKDKIIAYPKTVFHNGKITLGKPPKSIKPKAFQRVLNTIPMPMRVKNVPFKPVGISENKRGGRQPSQSPSPPRPKPPVEELAPLDTTPYDWLPVRKPEKNQIAIQQLTLADSQRYERVILGDCDNMTEQLLLALKNEGKIQAYRFQGTEQEPQAEVILNGGLVNMAKFTRMKKNMNEQHGLGRVTTQILQEQFQRNGLHTLQGQRSSTANHSLRSPARVSQNFMSGQLADQSAKGAASYRGSYDNLQPPVEPMTFNEAHSPVMHGPKSRQGTRQGTLSASKLQQPEDDVKNNDASPRIELNEMLSASRMFKMNMQERELRRSQDGSRSRVLAVATSSSGSQVVLRPQTNNDERNSPYQKRNNLIQQ